MTDKITKNTALTLATISSFTTPFLMSSINVALPTIGRLFEMHAVLLSWVATSYILASVVFLVPSSKGEGPGARHHSGRGIFRFISRAFSWGNYYRILVLAGCFFDKCPPRA